MDGTLTTGLCFRPEQSEEAVGSTSTGMCVKRGTIDLAARLVGILNIDGIGRRRRRSGALQFIPEIHVAGSRVPSGDHDPARGLDQSLVRHTTITLRELVVRKTSLSFPEP